MKQFDRQEKSSQHALEELIEDSGLSTRTNTLKHTHGLAHAHDAHRYNANLNGSTQVFRQNDQCLEGVATKQWEEVVKRCYFNCYRNRCDRKAHRQRVFAGASKNPQVVTTTTGSRGAPVVVNPVTKVLLSILQLFYFLLDIPLWRNKCKPM